MFKNLFKRKKKLSKKRWSVVGLVNGKYAVARATDYGTVEYLDRTEKFSWSEEFLVKYCLCDTYEHAEALRARKDGYKIQEVLD